MKFRTIILTYSLFAFLLACNPGQKEEVPLDKINLKLDFSRFDVRLYEAVNAIRKDSTLPDTSLYSKLALFCRTRGFALDAAAERWATLAKSY